MAECRPQNYPKLKDYKPSRFMLPTCHYDAAKADRAVTFIENLRHTKGKWAGKRFWLLPWQEQIIRDVFGIIHGGNPVMAWMAGNVVVDTDPAGNIKPTKAKSPEKIDGIVAAIMALDRCIRNEGQQQGSVYDERDMIVF